MENPYIHDLKLASLKAHFRDVECKQKLIEGYVGLAKAYAYESAQKGNRRAWISCPYQLRDSVAANLEEEGFTLFHEDNKRIIIFGW